MTIRMFLLPALIAGLLATTACRRSGDGPPAPEAKGEKTNAELLVGIWECVRQEPPVLPGAKKTALYEADGKVRIYRSGPREKPSLQKGTYRVEGNVITNHFTNPANPDGPTIDVTFVIEAIAADRLVLVYMSGDERQVSEYRRAKEE